MQKFIQDIITFVYFYISTSTYTGELSVCVRKVANLQTDLKLKANWLANILRLLSP